MGALIKKKSKGKFEFLFQHPQTLNRGLGPEIGTTLCGQVYFGGFGKISKT